MPNKTFNARVQMKRDTSANWTSNNPVLLNGEIIIVDTDAGEVRFKVGNGTSTYTQLPYTDEAIISKMLSLSGGTMTGNINMDGNVVTGLGAPVNPTDAVRQQDLEVLSDEIDGIIAGTSPITLPIASDVRLGGVKVGEGVEIAEDGTLNVNGFVPETRTVNGKALTQNISLTADEVGARPDTWTPTAEDVGAMPEVTGGTTGQVLTKTVDGQEWADGGMTQDAADARYLKLSGGTMTGPVSILGEELQASLFDLYSPAGSVGAGGYIAVRVETRSSGHAPGPVIMIPEISFTATPGMNVPWNYDDVFLSNIRSPSLDTDAANKAYVDSKDPTAQTITLSSSSWSASGSIYQQVANVTGVTADTPVIIVEPSLSTTDADANATILEAWNKIAQLEMTQGAGTITFRATGNPGVNVPVKVGVC